MPLSGVRVLDLTRLLPGPYATRLLAELGADVIKVESPEAPDYVRFWPPLIGDPPLGAQFREINAGKRSLLLDLKRPEAQAVFWRLLPKVDVLVDGFRPGVLARLGLDPLQLAAKNPRLIYCALTGYGQTGPDANRAGHDINYLARAGALSLTGEADMPVTLGIQVADLSSALVAVAGINAALFERERTGRGKRVDVSLVESAMSFATMGFASQRGGIPPDRRTQVLDGSRPCYRIYRTQDGKFLSVGALEPKFWASFVQAIQLPEVQDAALDGGEAGARATLKVAQRIAEKTQEEWLSIFRTADACVEPVLEVSEVEGDLHHRARGVFHPTGFVKSPIRVESWPDTPAVDLAARDRVLGPAPALGADSRDVLRELGIDEASITALFSD